MSKEKGEMSYYATFLKEPILFDRTLTENQDAARLVDALMH